jgi:Rrf2 family protein
MSFFGDLSSKEQNGLRLILRLAETYYSKKPISLNDISKEEGISLKYLEQLMISVRQAGWIKSQLGREGGYLMTKNPAKISLREVMNLLNDNPSLVACLDGNYVCPRQKNCRSRVLWLQLKKTVDQSLDKITLTQAFKK